MLNFEKLGKEIRPFIASLRDDSERLSLSNLSAKGFLIESKFGRREILIEGKYKNRGFGIRMDPEGCLFLIVNGPGGGEHTCRFGDEMVFRHRLESVQNDAEKKRELILALVERIDGDLLMPSNSLISKPAILRQPLIDWIHGLHSAIISGTIR
ncbi:MAG: hypothetical protein KGH54_04585 [Candidatus Micrarchaeota archaeon]|nr:hypothetical protein [Candidatus Micrarchaeota archaeon]